jgi:hypothetical protein
MREAALLEDSYKPAYAGMPYRHVREIAHSLFGQNVSSEKLLNFIGAGLQRRRRDVARPGRLSIGDVGDQVRML